MKRSTSLSALFVVSLLIVQAGCGALIVRSKSLPSLIGHDGFDWVSHDTGEAVTIYAESDSRLAAELSQIGEKAIEARQTVLNYLGTARYEATLSVLLLDSRERMKGLIGRATNATGYHESNAVCMVWSRTGTAGLRHELAHVIAMNEWGVPDRWVNEGVAVDITGDWLGRDPHEIAARLQHQGELPRLAELIGKFESFPSAISYPAAGSFLKFVRVTHGKEAVRGVWKDGDSSLTESTSRSLVELERDWLQAMAAAAGEAAKTPYDWRRITPADGD